MNPTQAENLRILIRHMETNVARTLSMDHYADSCGAPACALGEATVCAALAHLQLPRARLLSRSREGMHFAGYDDTVRLFASGCLNAWRRDNVTPQEWAAEARKVLAENGYAIDDGFAAFKAKVLMPVAFEIA